MADWPQDDITAFASCLKRFDNGIEAIGGRPWPRPSSRDEETGG